MQPTEKTGFFGRIRDRKCYSIKKSPIAGMEDFVLELFTLEFRTGLPRGSNPDSGPHRRTQAG
jgi:hypothetical protein